MISLQIPGSEVNSDSSDATRAELTRHTKSRRLQTASLGQMAISVVVPPFQILTCCWSRRTSSTAYAMSSLISPLTQTTGRRLHHPLSCLFSIPRQPPGGAVLVACHSTPILLEETRGGVYGQTGSSCASASCASV